VLNALVAGELIVAYLPEQGLALVEQLDGGGIILVQC
jgi:hypothetical protein